MKIMMSKKNKGNISKALILALAILLVSQLFIFPASASSLADSEDFMGYMEDIAEDMEEIHHDMHKIAFSLRLIAYSTIVMAVLLLLGIIAIICVSKK